MWENIWKVLELMSGDMLEVILEPARTNEMRLITAFDATESRRKLYREKKQKVTG